MNEPVRISERWRVRGAPWPTERDAQTCLVEFYDEALGWLAKFTIGPNGPAAIGGGGADWAALGVWLGADPPGSPKTYEQWLADGKTGCFAWINIALGGLTTG